MNLYNNVMIFLDSLVKQFQNIEGTAYYIIMTLLLFLYYVNSGGCLTDVIYNKTNSVLSD